MPVLPEVGCPAGPGQPGLAGLQLGFVREVLHREDAGTTGRILTRPGGDAAPGAASRIGIHRSNARENFANALAAGFPLLESCIGATEFRRLAWSYQRAHPSRSGNLFHVGNALSHFLEAHVTGSPDEYLIDVARLEWLVQQALVAADAGACADLARVAGVPPDQQGNLGVELHPSVRLLATSHAMFPLWEAHQAGLRVDLADVAAPVKPAPLAIPPPREPEHLLVQRQADGVRLHRLPERDYHWLLAVKQGRSLGESTNLLGDADVAAGGATLAGLLQDWLSQGVITGFLLPDPAR